VTTGADGVDIRVLGPFGVGVDDHPVELGGPQLRTVPDFGYDQGWRVESHPRFATDITGDGRADIVGSATPGSTP
jgi:hypothetical protein